jgi:DNA glycosylase AlkZ-like
VPSADRHGFAREPLLRLAEPGEGPGDARELVRRYLAAYGPAGVADCQEWSGVGALAPAFESLRGELEHFVDERGRDLFDLPGAPRPPAETAAPVRLLGEFDAVMLAHADRSRLIADEHRAKLTTRNLRVNAIALHDGEACATWRISRSARLATLELTPFRALARTAIAELEAEAMALLAATEAGSARHAFAVAPS